MAPGKLHNLEDGDQPSHLVTEGILVVDLNFELLACDRGGGAILKEFGSGTNGDAHLPVELRELLHAQPFEELAASIFYVNIGSRDYGCRTFLLVHLNGGGQPKMLALHMQRAESLNDALNKVAAEYHLTDREREAMGGIALGLTTKALAAKMKISPNTVNSFLRLIMIKTHVTTRAGLVGKVLEQNGAAARSSFRALRRGGFSA